MFDCKQDIGLLHASLLSAAYSNSGSLFDCADVKDAVNIVYNSVKMIIHQTLNGIKDEKEKIKIRLHSNERLHSAIFFTTLRSHGIKSEAADDFYESILYNWPSIDLKFYLELNFKCDWSEYFIKCALLLPSEILFKVLKMILDIPFPSNIEYYAWHLIVQTLILRLLKVPCDNEVKYPFDFDFTAESTSVKDQSDNEITKKDDEIMEKCNKEIAKNDEIMEKFDKITEKREEITENDNKTTEEYNEIIDQGKEITGSDSKVTENGIEINEINEENTGKDTGNDLLLSKPDMTSLFKEMFNNLCDHIAIKVKVPNEIDVIKILLHSVKTLLKSLIAEKKKDDVNALQFSDFLKICKLLNDFLESSANREILKLELQRCSNEFISHVYATASWNISLNYLIFLLSYYVDETYPDFCSHSLSENIGLIHRDMVCTALVDSLKYLNSPLLKSDECLKILCKVIQFGFQGSSYAAKMFLCNPVILERNDIQMMLEENYHVIDFSLSYSLMLDSINVAKSRESKLNLLKIFYKLLCKNEMGMYNTVLGYILSNYGLTGEFQLPDFGDQLSQFRRKTPTLKEAEKILPALFIQNPMTILKYLIDQALVQGSEGKLFIQLLKHFQHACFYRENSGSVIALHEVLDEYFKKTKLETFESKNMVTLYKCLVEVHSETPILFPCSFFKRCIVPKLYPEYDNIRDDKLNSSRFIEFIPNDKIELILQCAHVLMPALLSDGCFLKNSESLQSFVISFGMLAHHFIVTGNGKMKSLVTPILKELELHQVQSEQIKDEEKIKLWATFKDKSEMVCVYIKEFLPRDIEFVRKSYVWTWCCKNEDSSLFEEKFSVETLTYMSLVNTLVEVLSHLTKEEWLYSINLVKICCKNDRLRDEIVCSNNSFQLSGCELDMYAAVLSVVTSLHFILNDNIDSSVYVSSCFSSSLINLLSQKETENMHMLLSVVLEVCYLVSCISPDLIHVYNATLLELKKQIIASSSLESDQRDCWKLISDAVVCLPDSSAKDFLFQKM